VSLAETELTIGGTSFKGVYIAILLSLATTLGGGVWTASSLYSRLESVESQQIPDIAPLEEKILLVEQELSANDVSQLQGKLATLGVSLKTIAEQQEKLLLIRNDVNDMKQKVAEMKATVQKAELLSADIKDFTKDVSVAKREIQDLWDAMDYLSNPLN